jgi:hypothetical protein
MTVDRELLSDCQEWRRLAETEGEAIRTCNWALATDCQQALERLQPQMSQHFQNAREEWKRLGLDSAEKDRVVRALIAELIEIESRNKTLLNRLQQDAQSRLHQLQQASRTLRRVQSSYAQARPVPWTSLS